MYRLDLEPRISEPTDPAARYWARKMKRWGVYARHTGSEPGTSFFKVGNPLPENEQSTLVKLVYSIKSIFQKIKSK